MIKIEITISHSSSRIRVPHSFADDSFCPATTQEMVSMCESPSAAKILAERIQSAMQGGHEYQIYIEEKSDMLCSNASRIILWISSRAVEVLIDYGADAQDNPLDYVPSCLQFKNEDGDMDSVIDIPSTYHFDDGWIFGVSAHQSIYPGLDVFELARKVHNVTPNIHMLSDTLIEYRSFMKCIRQPMTFLSKKTYSFTMKGRSHHDRDMLEFFYDQMLESIQFRAWGAAILGEGFSDLSACYSLFSSIPMDRIRVSTYRVEFDGADDGTFNTWAVLNDDAHIESFYLTGLQVRICALVFFLFVSALELLSKAHDNQENFDRIEWCRRLCGDMKSLHDEFVLGEKPLHLNSIDSEQILGRIGRLAEEAPELFEPEDVRVALERVQQTLEKSEGRST